MADVNIKLDDNRNFKNKIPILIEDEYWLELFNEADNRAIKKYKGKLAELLKEQIDTEKEIKRLEKEKTKTMKMILIASDEINNEEKPEYINLLDEYRERLIFINETIDKLTFKLENIPTDIKETNFKLLEVTISYGYTQIKDKEERLDYTKKELKILREKIRKLNNEKREYEDYIGDTYTFIHRILGGKQVEKLDDLIFEE